MMRENLRDAAPYVSIFGLFLLAATALLGAAATQVPREVVLGLRVLGAVLLLAWPALRPHDLKAALGVRQTRYGGNALLLAVSVIGILAVLNYLGTLWFWSWDLTENKQFTLSRQTIQILNDLDAPVSLTAVIEGNDAQTVDELNRLVEQYKQRAPNLEFTHIDPAREPVQVRSLAMSIEREPTTLNRTLIAQSGGRHEVVYSFDEQGVSEAIVKATRTRDLAVWFTTGHGERSLDQDYSRVRTGLESQGYTVEQRILATLTETLTTDIVQAVVVAGPSQPFTDEEAQILARYVSSGGSVLMLLDPPLDGADPNLGSVYLPWEIRPRNDVVLDPARAFVDPTLPLVPANELRFHTLTRDLMDVGQPLVFPGSQSFAVGQSLTTTLVSTILAESSPNSWGETDLQAIAAREQVAQTEGEAAGPLAMAVAAEGEEGHGRLVMIGTSEFVSDAFLQQIPSTLNGGLLLNALNWLTQEEDLISIPATPPDSRELSIAQHPLWLLATTTLLIPLAVLGIGTWLWRRRR